MKKIARKHKIEYIISDNTEMAVLKEINSNYAVSVMSELTRLGMKKMAFILPKNIFVKMSVKNFTEDSKKKQGEINNIAHFDSVEKA